MKNNAIYVAVGLTLLGLLLGIFIRSGFVSLANRDRIVTVRGLAEKEVNADKVTWPLTYNILDNDLQSLYAQFEENNAKIIKFLTDNGIKEDEFCVFTPDITDNQANIYSNDAVYRYRANVTVTVSTSNVDLVRSLINRQSELIKQGVAISTCDGNSTIFEYTGLNEIKPEMIAEATKKAREAADKFAEDSGCKVGKLMSASQGQFSIEYRDPYTVHNEGESSNHDELLN